MFSKKPAEPIPEVETSIWVCNNEECNGWMRDNFSFEVHPTCPLCHSEMSSDTRVLPVLVNHILHK